jgi:hypothetical protein
VKVGEIGDKLYILYHPEGKQREAESAAFQNLLSRTVCVKANVGGKE